MVNRIVFISFAILQAIINFYAYTNFCAYQNFIIVRLDEKMLSNAERLATIVEPIVVLFAVLWITWCIIQFSKNILIRFYASIFILLAFFLIWVSSRYFSLFVVHICS